MQNDRGAINSPTADLNSIDGVANCEVNTLTANSQLKEFINVSHSPFGENTATITPQKQKQSNVEVGTWSQVVRHGKSGTQQSQAGGLYPKMKLQYFEPTKDKERIVVKPPNEVVSRGSLEWETCLVGYFVEKKLYFSVVNHIAHKS